MRFEAVIFDLDGTLLDSMDVWEKIDICFLQKRGLTVPADYVAEICARSFEEAAQYTIDLFGLSEKSEDIIREWNEMAVYEYAHHVKLSPYAWEYLIELKKRGMKLAVATGLPRELFLPCLEHNSVLGLFDILCSTDEIKRGKEYPDIFELAAQRLGAVPQHCLVFEDVLPAVKSAKQAGMLVCAVYDKYSARYRVQMEQVADLYIADFRDAPLPDAEFEDENEKG